MVSDAKDIYEIFSNDAITQYYDVSTYTSVNQAEQFIARMNDRFATGEGIRWALALKSTNQLIGTCGYNAISQRSQRAIIGYELKQIFWGQGYMPEALQAILRYGFEELSLNRIEAFVMLDNHQSVCMLKKLRFVEEGILREYGFWKSKFWDLHCFSLLKREFCDRA
ncbi:GNAT family N-acetyltransferase [Trichocoleus sp. FACHB-46]|uniref:GNAT family N-acetyltransferase n=1 Tax=Trichocoleus TaxID=450526 RepID=UPI00351B984B